MKRDRDKERQKGREVRWRRGGRKTERQRNRKIRGLKDREGWRRGSGKTKRPGDREMGR